MSCEIERVEALVNFGPQPPSNRFEHPRSAPCETHPLVVGQCAACGLIQLIDPMPPTMAKSHFEWITYNEPEGHLDSLVDTLRHLPGIDHSSRIVGLTYKDDSTITRFNKLGYTNTYRIDATTDLGLQDPCAGLESIQSIIDQAVARDLVAKHGPADLLLVRHVLEHAHDPAAFMAAVRKLVKPNGYLLFEVPDCAKFIKACDYTFIWEEHIAYFNAQTLAAFIANTGLETQQVISYPYPLEDSLICIARNEPAAGASESSQGAVYALLEEGNSFAKRYSEVRAHLHQLFSAWQQTGKNTAIFGAGHLAAKFVNMYSLGELVNCVIDDNPHKQTLTMPGSRLAICGSAALELRDIHYCLLSLNPESEQKVLAKNQAFLDRGGKFLSIFRLSLKTVYNAKEHEPAQN